MEIKLFGKSLFEVKSGNAVGQYLYNSAVDKLKESKFMIDFYRDTGQANNGFLSFDYAVAAMPAGALEVKGKKGAKAKKAAKPVAPKELTPKDVYILKTLDDKDFQIKTDPAYVDEQIATFTEKLGMIKKQEADWNYGTTEIGSILMRLENRKKYPDHKEFFGEFPYTTTAKIGDLVKEYSYLQLGEVSQFLADMPKDAVDVMKNYTKECEKLCDKKPVFYIIANKKDFQKSQSRRDPILLAQSPFGHFWQILGAWDEEMLLIEEL